MASDNIKRHVSHVKSNRLNGTNPVLPTPGDILHGEIAVNYATGYETLAIRNDSNHIITFSSDGYMSKAITNAINALDATKSGNSTHVGVSVSEADGKITGVSVSETGITDYNTFTAHTASSVHMSNTEKTNLDSLATNIATISAINSTNVSNWNTAYSNNHTHGNKSVLDSISSTNVSNWNTAYSNNHTHGNKSVLDSISSTNVSNWNTAYSNNHTHSNKSYLDNISGYLGSMAYESTSSYSSATQVYNALLNKADKSEIIRFYSKHENNCDTLSSNSYIQTAGDAEGAWSGTYPASGNNAKALFHFHTHKLNFFSQLLLDTAGNLLWMRSMNNVSWTSWVYMIHSGNIGSQSVNYASSAGSVDWANVSNKPTNVSSFTNDSGYITSAALGDYLPKSGGTVSGTTYFYGKTELIGNGNGIVINTRTGSDSSPGQHLVLNGYTDVTYLPSYSNALNPNTYNTIGELCYDGFGYLRLKNSARFTQMANPFLSGHFTRTSFSITLNDTNDVVFCSSTNVTITLPSNPLEGKRYYLYPHGGGTTLAVGNSSHRIVVPDGSQSTSTSLEGWNVHFLLYTNNQWYLSWAE